MEKQEIELDERWDGFQGIETLTRSQLAILKTYIEKGTPDMEDVQDFKADGEHESGWFSVIEEKIS